MAETTSQTPVQGHVYQTPEWETPLHPPRRSPFGWFSAPPPGLAKPRPDNGDTQADVTMVEVATHASSRDSQNQRVSNAYPHPSRRRAFRALFDAFLPPHRKYFGRSRRWFLLAVVLPLAVLLFLVLPIALGVGLSKKSPKNLPIPKDTSITYTGDLTFYAPGLGACGWNSTDAEPICAVSHELWDALQKGKNPNTNPLCGLRIRVQRDFVEEGKGLQSIEVTVVDRCTGCKPTDLDLSPGMFNGLAKEEDGRLSGHGRGWIRCD